MGRKRFRYVPHTADASFIAYGKDMAELIENAAYAMLCLMFDVKKIENAKNPAKAIRISEHAHTPEDLLWFTLQDILSKIDIHSVKAFIFRISSLKAVPHEMKLSGTLYHKEAGSDTILLGIKAVTPHGMKVEKTKNGYSVKVVVDI